MNEQQFIEKLKEHQIEISDHQLQLFNQYYEILVDYNTKVNLTAITEKEEVYLKHFYDSLTLLNKIELKNGASLCDVGAGAGFPSVPLKIVRPDLDITIVDSLGKRITFLNYLFEQLGLTNIKAIHSRAEEFSVEYRESFDFVTARAVARLNILAELCIPLTKLNGNFIALKASSGEEEMTESKTAIKTLGCELKENYQFELPFDGGTRHILLYQKVKTTPKKYPRSYSKIKNKPL